MFSVKKVSFPARAAVAQLSWVSWVPEPIEPSSLGFAALATNLVNPAKTQLLMF